jgi:hypothetical protein
MVTSIIISIIDRDITAVSQRAESVLWHTTKDSTDRQCMIHTGMRLLTDAARLHSVDND